MHNGQLTFEERFRRHLPIHQRRALVQALARDLDGSMTLGDVVDATESLGWGDLLGDISLHELSRALGEDISLIDRLAAQAADTHVETDEAASNTAPPQATSKTTSKTTPTRKRVSALTDVEQGRAAATGKLRAKPASKATNSAEKPALKKTPKKESVPAAVQQPAAAAKIDAKTSSKARLASLRRRIDADEPMTLDEAAELLLPMVRALDMATMQALEETTGIGRRKLRFHIGQLVREGHLHRHGMGRGTHYTVA